MITLEEIPHFHPNQLPGLYFLGGYVYENIHRYPTGTPLVMTDPAWDALCNRIDAEWEKIDPPRLKLIQREELTTATASYLTDAYLPRGVHAMIATYIIDPEKTLSNFRFFARKG
jgi:hypothetical protein